MRGGTRDRLLVAGPVRWQVDGRERADVVDCGCDMERRGELARWQSEGGGESRVCEGVTVEGRQVSVDTAEGGPPRRRRSLVNWMPSPSHMESLVTALPLSFHPRNFRSGPVLGALDANRKGSWDTRVFSKIAFPNTLIEFTTSTPQPTMAKTAKTKKRRMLPHRPWDTSL